MGYLCLAHADVIYEHLRYNAAYALNGIYKHVVCYAADGALLLFLNSFGGRNIAF